MSKHFFHKGEPYVLSVEHAIDRDGCHVFLTGEKTRKNLSLDFPGENLFPHVQVHGDHFYVTWILSGNHHHSQQQQVYACYYDSYSDTGFYTFIIFPMYTHFYSKIYYRIQASDRDGNTSGFTSIREIELNEP